MFTLPVMSEDQCRKICNAVQLECDEAWPYKHFTSELVLAFVKARDAQWSEAMDAAVTAEVERLMSADVLHQSRTHKPSAT